MLDSVAVEQIENPVEEVQEASISEQAIDAVQTTSTKENLIDDTTEVKVDEAIENAKWYVLHTFSGYENVAKENLEIVKEKYNLQERIFDIVIPMEDVVEEKNGKQKIVSRKVMPGYIMVKMIYGDDIWHAVTRTRGITGFVGPKGRPLHLTEEEIRKMRLEKNTVVDVSIAENDKVEVLDGALNGFVGTVISVDKENLKCKVMVEMFGRDTPVDLNLDQVRKFD
ncbi:MAG: transcription termination/antitermination factor NusG [Clostridia bacterium]|nr:transcription termination/antitermination factor NusG [Clostridia bacterium]